MNDQTPSIVYASDKQLAERFSVGRATIWRWSSSGNFPKPVVLSPGCTRWKLSEVEKWESGRAEA